MTRTGYSVDDLTHGSSQEHESDAKQSKGEATKCMEMLCSAWRRQSAALFGIELQRQSGAGTSHVKLRLGSEWYCVGIVRLAEVLSWQGAVQRCRA